MLTFTADNLDFRPLLSAITAYHSVSSLDPDSLTTSQLLPLLGSRLTFRAPAMDLLPPSNLDVRRFAEA